MKDLIPRYLAAGHQDVAQLGGDVLALVERQEQPHGFEVAVDEVHGLVLP